MAVASETMDRIKRVRLTVHGVVQGVGFRPFVCRLARELQLGGHVFNSGDGVAIEVEGNETQLDAFSNHLRTNRPPQADVRTIETVAMRARGERKFRVLESHGRVSSANRVPSDLATCKECRAEISDPKNRRFDYPFTNCTQCGPRYSVIEGMPYDRARTTMNEFAMCADCRSEYEDIADRRFHAEPTACAACGPRVELLDADGSVLASAGEALDKAAHALLAGRIVALKGIGGYHLMVDATDEAAVRRLRDRKERPTKPLAILVPSFPDAHAIALLHPADEALLLSAAAPIVLAPRRDTSALTDAVAPRCGDVGLFLPYSPLHRLIMQRVGRPVVATSANRSGEPMIFQDAPALTRLRGVADVFLAHNRRIHRPVDDSVARTIDGASQTLRLGRGYTPGAITIRSVAPAGRSVLALGGHLKVAPALLVGQQAFLGQHVGDLSSLAAEDTLKRAVADLEALHGCRADIVACDLHPDYASTRMARELGRPVVGVQHHVAHIASVIAEHGIDEPVLGIAWDGTGYGPDGTIWGGEFLHVDRGRWERIARLKPFALPGGDRAVREPRRSALGVAHAMDRSDLTPPAFDATERKVLVRMIEQRLLSPLTSSAGRLFDACAALVGLCQVARHEGEAPMALEAAASIETAEPYPFRITQTPDGLREVDWGEMIEGLSRDMSRGIPLPRIARAIHETLAAVIAETAAACGRETIVLSGGCFQNRLLTERAIARLRDIGKRVFINRVVPPGDGGLALGQALWARWQMEAV